MEELKRCLFCGGKATDYAKKDRSVMYGTYGYRVTIFCQNCGAKVTKWSEILELAVEAAEKTWNTRKPVEDVLERLEAKLHYADSEKKRCAKENPLQFDRAEGYAHGLYNAIEIIKGELLWPI